MKRIFIGGLILIAAALALRFDAFEMLERKSLDLRFRLRGPLKSGIAAPFLVAIDDASLERFGRWPWDRRKHAELIEGLSRPEEAPVVLAYDVLFDQGDPDHPESDSQLVGAFAKDLPPKVLAYFFDFAKDSIASPFPVSCAEGITDRGFFKEIPEATAVTLPMPELCGKPLLGFVNVPLDPDGLTRRMPLLYRYQERLYPSFDFQVALAALKIPFDQIRMEKNRIWLDERHSVPVNDAGEIWVNWYGPPTIFEAHPFHEFLLDLVRRQAASETSSSSRDRIVMVGFAATGLGQADQRTIPFHANTPGIILHASAVMNLWEGNALRRLGREVIFPSAILLGFLSLLGVTFLGTASSFVFLLSLAAVYFGAAQWVFSRQAIWLDVVPVEAAIFLPSLAVILDRYFTEARDRRRLKALFQKYVSRNVLESLLKNPSQVKLGGIRRKISILFADLVQFTSYCEKNPPEQVVKQLNEFFGEMTEAVFAHHGTLDKFVGDSVIAFFGAPQEAPASASALAAVACGLEMKRRMEALQEKWRKVGMPPLEMGVGINTGEAVVGNVGSGNFMEYTVIGDTVNVCARIEGLTREFGAFLVVTESTYREVEDKVEAKFLGKIGVKGRKEEVSVYAISRLREETSPRLLSTR